MAKVEIRYRRLYAFYESKVLNALMITVVTSLLLMAYTQSMLMPVICGAIALVCFIGYSIWLWVKKPQLPENGLLILYGGLRHSYCVLKVRQL